LIVRIKGEKGKFKRRTLGFKGSALVRLAAKKIHFFDTPVKYPKGFLLRRI